MWQKLKNYYHLISAILANIGYGFPGKKIRVIGVTGTDGKSTTVHLIHNILTQAGKNAAVISSVYTQIDKKISDTGFHVTTPSPWVLIKWLKQAVEEGDEYLVLEVTSHAIDQNRIWGIDFEIAVLTNITNEHLDYHKTFSDYVNTKFKFLKQAESVILNKDDQSFDFHYLVNNQLVTYALNQDADYNLKKFTFTTKLPGKYNLSNCLAAAAVGKQLGIADSIIKQALKSFIGIKGRFEYIDTGKDFQIVIDFAHTPNAFQQVLFTLKPLVKGKLIHVFGCAGLRDRNKRSVMGKISAEYADVIVLTEEDYRTENVNQIIDQIAQGCLKQGVTEIDPKKFHKNNQLNLPVFMRIPNRLEAIYFAINQLASNGDVILLTGKAHEKSLCRGKTETSWNEHQVVLSALKKLTR